MDAGNPFKEIEQLSKMTPGVRPVRLQHIINQQRQRINELERALKDCAEMGPALFDPAKYTHDEVVCMAGALEGVYLRAMGVLGTEG